MTNPDQERENVRFDLSDIDARSIRILREIALAQLNGQVVPDSIHADLIAIQKAAQSLDERQALLNNTAPPPRPYWIDPLPIISSLEFRKLFTEEEKTKITTAGEQSSSIRVFLDDETASDNVNLLDPIVSQGLAMLVSSGLLTQERANSVLMGTPPASE